MADMEKELLSDRQRTYTGFKRLVLWSGAASLQALALMALFLT